MPVIERWKRISEVLRNAAEALPDNVRRSEQDAKPVPVGRLVGSLDEFYEFLAHNEFELAWDALAAVAKRARAGPALWLLLARAATLMSLKPRTKFATTQLVKSLKSDEPGYRLVYQRRYRNRQGRIVWQKPSRIPKRQGLTPA
jgi:hypothetical protein